MVAATCCATEVLASGFRVCTVTGAVGCTIVSITETAEPISVLSGDESSVADIVVPERSAMVLVMIQVESCEVAGGKKVETKVVTGCLTYDTWPELVTTTNSV